MSGSYARVVRRRSSLAAVAMLVAGAAVVSVGATRFVRTGDASAECNGHAELCSRRYDQVAFAATHNAMSTVADGFTAPYQERSILDQLANGVRTFLIDVYAGTQTAERVCTDPTPLKVRQLRRDQGQGSVDQLLAIRNAQCPPAGGPTASVYLCHGFCELGATKFSDTLAGIRQFLDDHPNDVVTLILEDYAEAPHIVQALRDAGLERSLVHHEPGKRWPTLRQMKRRGTRLVVFAQNQGGDAPGLLDAFEEMGETPYSFRSAAEFSCRPNRGPAEAPRLFLLNHWVDDPNRRPAAAIVNDYEVLSARAERCERARDHLPNFVAVNFAEDGDLLRVVDDLNGF
jgi:hypothetical protein